MNCDEVSELLPAYVLGALDAEELEAVEAHLRAGREHDAELVELRATVFALDSLGGEIELEPAPVAAPSRPERSAGGARLFRRPVWQAATAVVLLLAAFGAGWLASGLAGDGSSEDVAIFLQGAQGMRLEVYSSDTEGNVAVGMHGFDKLPDDKSYQIWAVRDGEWLRVGVCNVDDEGDWWGDFEFTIRPGEQLALTIEPAGGSAAPTSEPLLSTLSR